MTTVVLLEMTFTADGVGRVPEVLGRILAETRAFEGCEGVDVLVDITDPLAYTLVERWRTLADNDAYRAWRAGEGAISDLAPLLAAGKPSVRTELTSI